MTRKNACSAVNGNRIHWALRMSITKIETSAAVKEGTSQTINWITSDELGVDQNYSEPDLQYRNKGITVKMALTTPICDSVVIFGWNC